MSAIFGGQLKVRETDRSGLQLGLLRAVLESRKKKWTHPKKFWSVLSLSGLSWQAASGLDGRCTYRVQVQGPRLRESGSSVGTCLLYECDLLVPTCNTTVLCGSDTSMTFAASKHRKASISIHSFIHAFTPARMSSAAQIANRGRISDQLTAIITSEETAVGNQSVFLYGPKRPCPKIRSSLHNLQVDYLQSNLIMVSCISVPYRADLPRPFSMPEHTPFGI